MGTAFATNVQRFFACVACPSLSCLLYLLSYHLPDVCTIVQSFEPHHASLSLIRSRSIMFCCGFSQSLQKVVQTHSGFAKPVIHLCRLSYTPLVFLVPLPQQCRTSCRREPSSISNVFEAISKSTSYQSKTTRTTMTVPTLTPTFPDIPYPSSLSSVVPIIISDLSPSPHTSQSPPSTTQLPPGVAAVENPESTAAAASPGDGLSDSKLTAVIVVPIVLLAILSPILIVWFLSWRRRRRHPSYNRRSIPKEEKFEREKEKEKEKNPVDSPPQARQLRSSPAKRSTASLPPPPRRPFTTTPDHRRNTQQPRTSRISNHSLSGFNFDFSRRTSMFSARSTQPTIRDPNLRPSSTYTFILPPPSASRPMTLAQPYIAPRIPSPKLPESPIYPDQLSDINPETSRQQKSKVLPHPDRYGKVHTRVTSSYSLSAENLSIHNGSNLQAPFSQPHPDAVSEISGLSFDHALWVATQQPQRDPDAVSEVSALEPDPNSDMNPHQIV